MSILNGIAAPIAGGLLIGLSASILLVFKGRIAGISGMVGGAITRPRETWRLAFLGGLLLGGGILAALFPSLFVGPVDRSFPAIALAGLLVGIGTRIGNGCTSGHGVCGIGRLSKRSLAATVTFIGIGALTATGMHWLGAGS